VSVQIPVVILYDNMELQLGFDDEDLTIESKRKPEGDLYVPYHVKLCVPEWFEDEAHELHARETGSTEDLQSILKFSADFNYQQKDYLKAAQQYEAALDVIPENNLSLRQDVKESLCRSLMYSGNSVESLKLAKRIMADSLEEDVPHQKQALMLYFSMCEVVGQWKDCVEALEKLCSLSPYYEKFWLRLGHAYLKLTSLHSHLQQNDDVYSEDELFALALTSFLKAQILLHHSIFRASAIMKERNKKLLDQTKETIKNLPMPENQKEFAFNWLRGKCTSETFESDLEMDEEEPSSIKADTISADSRSFFNTHCSWLSQYKLEICK